MLAEDMLQLLTAYVDGELSPRQRQDVLRLLYQSSEAREILRQLQENHHKVRQLPRRKLDREFAGEVVSAIGERQVLPIKPVARPAPSLLRWVPFALAGVAAAMLFVVALGGILYVTLDFGGDGLAVMIPDDSAVAKKDPEPAPVRPDTPKGDNSVQKKNPAPLRRPLSPMIARINEGVVQGFGTPMPPERANRFAFRDLTEVPVARQVAAELDKNNALELEITVSNNPQAVERLKRVLQKHDIRLVVDPATDAALKQAPDKTELLVYADNVKADELARILKELAQEEKKAATAFDTVTVAALSATDQKHVTDLFHEDPTRRVDPNARKGLQQKSPDPNPKQKAPPRVVAVLPPTPQPTASAELRRFLLQPVDPGSVRVLVRIRQK